MLRRLVVCAGVLLWSWMVFAALTAGGPQAAAQPSATTIPVFTTPTYGFDTTTSNYFLPTTTTSPFGSTTSTTVPASTTTVPASTTSTASTTTTSTIPPTTTTVAALSGELPAPTSTVPLNTKSQGGHVNSALAWLSLLGFLAAVGILVSRYVITRGRRLL
ncbi:MAG: hypothetical protein ACRDYC_10085 [Acidimicrobiales bacterium]